MPRARRVARAGEHRPALRDGVDAALVVGRGPERRAVVEVRAPVPLAVPAVLLELLRAAWRPPPRSVRRMASSPTPRRDRAELRQHLAQEEAQPDALAPALDADQVHAVVPVAGAHQRQAVRAEAQPVHDGAHAVLVEAGGSRRAAGQVVVRVVAGVHRAALEEVDRLVQDAGVAGRRHVAAPSPGAATDSRPSSACARRGPTGDATSAGRRPRRTGGSRSAAGARAAGRGSAWTSAIASCSWSRKPKAPPDW